MSKPDRLPPVKFGASPDSFNHIKAHWKGTTAGESESCCDAINTTSRDFKNSVFLYGSNGRSLLT